MRGEAGVDVAVLLTLLKRAFISVYNHSQCCTACVWKNRLSSETTLCSNTARSKDRKTKMAYIR